ncbi:hypothetical protein C8F04DRAFT_1240383 [Mycena alexandri]|uniref:Uncharacterized protein n=1 Tax=Mycena alexandri TaxID=1745969 RepID=A0AAD6SB69_9AGAR|nr:hypothetical protein C8F04DRAFT_1240383 [Mycena alexandri]
MSGAYSPLPTSASYPPKTLLARLAAAPPTRIRRLLPFVAVLALSSSLVVYFVFASSLSSSSPPHADSYNFDAEAETLQFDSSSSTPWSDDGPRSPFFRDAHPALHARLFLARAQAEIRARGLDTCGGQLGVPMVQGYMKAAVPYCEPRADPTDTSAASITCFPARAPSSPNGWWPYPQAFCAAHHLAHTPGWGGPMQDRGLFTGPCALTPAGRALKDAMGREAFLGTEFIEPDALLAAEGGRSKNGGGGDKGCAENVTHPVLFVPRQDRWNPFHVGEDLVTTFLALTLFSLTPPPPPPPAGGLGSWFSAPASAGTEASATNAHLLAALPETYFSLLAASSHNSHSSPSSSHNASTTNATAPSAAHLTRLKHELTQLTHALSHTAALQLVFSDAFLPTQNLFAPLWDRIGARVPRRMGLEGLGMDGGRTCLRTSFHSVGAGASLLSGTDVGRLHTCASELVWGAGLWLRWVWGLEGAAPFAPLTTSSTSASASADAEDGEGERGDGVYRRDASWDEEVEIEIEGEDAVGRRAPAPTRADLPQSTPIQVLFLSREKFDMWTKHSSKSKKLTPWQEARHIANEAALVAGLRAGLASLCRAVTPVPGGVATEHGHGRGGAHVHGCTYTDADALPAAWAVRMHAREARALGLGRGGGSGPTTPDPRLGGKDTGTAGAGDGRRDDPPTDSPQPPAHAHGTRADARASPPPRALRFATLDPTTSALATQLGAVGRADVVVSVHAGALGLSLFLPTGRASVVELVTTGAQGNNHFHNMAHMLGMQYVRVDVRKTVDVAAVVRAVREVVEERLVR